MSDENVRRAHTRLSGEMREEIELILFIEIEFTWVSHCVPLLKMEESSLEEFISFFVRILLPIVSLSCSKTVTLSIYIRVKNRQRNINDYNLVYKVSIYLQAYTQNASATR